MSININLHAVSNVNKEEVYPIASVSLIASKKSETIDIIVEKMKRKNVGKKFSMITPASMEMYLEKEFKSPFINEDPYGVRYTYLTVDDLKQMRKEYLGLLGKDTYTIDYLLALASSHKKNIKFVVELTT